MISLFGILNFIKLKIALSKCLLDCIPLFCLFVLNFIFSIFCSAIHQAARETIALAEERFANLKEKERQDGKERKFDAAWQEMLNHATMKVKMNLFLHHF